MTSSPSQASPGPSAVATAPDASTAEPIIVVEELHKSYGILPGDAIESLAFPYRMNGRDA